MLVIALLGIIHILRHQGIGVVGVGQNMMIDDSRKGGGGHDRMLFNLHISFAPWFQTKW